MHAMRQSFSLAQIRNAESCLSVSSKALSSTPKEWDEMDITTNLATSQRWRILPDQLRAQKQRDFVFRGTTYTVAISQSQRALSQGQNMMKRGCVQILHEVLYLCVRRYETRRGAAIRTKAPHHLNTVPPSQPQAGHETDRPSTLPPKRIHPPIHQSIIHKGECKNLKKKNLQPSH